MDTAPQVAGDLGHAANAPTTALYVKALTLIAVSALVFRFLRSSSNDRVLPAWAPIEIFITSTCLVAGGVWLKILSFVRRYGGSFFGITSKHQVIHNLQGVERLFAQPLHTLDNEPVGWTITIRVFGGHDSTELREKMNLAKKDLFTAVEKGFMNEANALDLIQKADVAGNAASLITFSSNSDDVQPWERSAMRKLIQPDVVEVDLENLIRDFGASMAIPLLYGSDFMKRNPGLLDDFWKFDNDVFPLLMVGVPSWTPVKAMKEGIAARARLLKALAALYERIDKYQNGEPVDADMSDVGQVAQDRCKAYAKQNMSYRHRGDIDFGLLWGQNANTQPLIFWFITYIYSTPDLLPALRKEILPYAPLSTTAPLRLTNLDYAGLSRDCPLLKSAYLETFRMANEASSLRYVGRPLTVTDGPHTHNLTPGTFITVPHGIPQRNPAIYADPDKFVPERFVETDGATGRRVARYGALKPWGMGQGMCKGRTFAEKEILGVVAAVISLWDFEPADGGAWKVPGMRPGTGVMRPTEKVRVRAKRRVVA